MMKITSFLITAAAFLVLLSGCTDCTLDIYFTASLNGNLSGCDCSGYPVAGLVKRVAFLRERNHQNSLLLDAGDVMEAGPDPLLTGYIFDFYRQLGYDAVAVGNNEFAEGIEPLGSYTEENPLFSHNLVFRNKSGELRFSNDVVRKNINGLAAGIVCLVDSEVFKLYPDSFHQKVGVLPPADVFSEKLENNSDVDLWIVLYHGYYKNAVKLAESEPEIDVLVLAHEEQVVEEQLGNGVILLSPGEEGNRLGRLELKIRNGEIASWENEYELFHYIRSPDDPEALAAAESYRKQLVERIRPKR